MSQAAFRGTGGLIDTFTPPGPKAEGWLYSHADVALIIGPYGSAKTSSGCMKAIAETRRQFPSKRDQCRRALCVAIRQNYRRMADTLIPSVREFFGTSAHWTGGSSQPPEMWVRWHEAGDAHELTIKFRAFQDQAIEAFVRGFQPSFWWANEFDELPAGAFSDMLGRIGRYRLAERPDPSEWTPVPHCKLFGDANMPDIDSWVHEFILKKPTPGVEVYIQPSGFSPQAENLHNLRKSNPKYYEDMATRFRSEGAEHKVKRFIENRAGYTPHGKPVYPEFNPELHIFEDGVITPDPNRQVLIGIDQGGQAAAVIAQRSREGGLVVFDEVVLDPGAFLGGEEFGRLLARRLLEPDFRRFCRRGGLVVRTDPAAMQRHSGSTEDDPRSWYLDFEDGLSAELGLPPDSGAVDMDIAPTNALKQRHQAVRKLLLTRGTHGENMRVHEGCQRLNRGFSGGYRYDKVQGTAGTYRNKPKKPDPHTDVHDALQYIALHVVPEMAGELRHSREPFAEMTAQSLEAQVRPLFDDAMEVIL